ncbi:hypothetical protein XPA_002305 [Xanthoria parietina]
MQPDNVRGFVPPPPGVEPNFTNPDYRSAGIVPITAVFVTLSTAFLAVRTYTKAHIIKIFGLEDYTISLAWLFNIGICMIALVQQKNGNGIHIWNITESKFLIFSRWGAAANIVYCPAVALAKVAILIFYLRLNPQKTFRYSVFAVLFITVGYMIALCFALFFQCRPVAKVWNPLLEGHCVNAKDLYLWNTILNVITDFLVILVPIPMLRTLQVGTRQKWVIGLLFGIGSLTCIISVIRTYFIAILLDKTDTSWEVPTSTSLIVVETNLSIICGCIMVLRPFVRRHLPFLLGAETRRGRRAGAGAGAAIYDGYQRSNDTKTKISGAKSRKSNTTMSGSRGGGGGGLLSWVGGRRVTGDTDRTYVGADDGREDVELANVGVWPLKESGRSGGGGGKSRDARSESEENIIEQPLPIQGGIIKTVKVDVR